MESFKSYFYFTKSERMGILTLIFFIVLSMAAPSVSRLLLAGESGFNEEISPEVQDFINSLSDTNMQKDQTYVSQENENSYPAVIRNLDTKVSNYRENQHFQNMNKQVSTQVQVELNTVDSIGFIRLNGIGPAFAHRILKYRSRLGGFVSVEQLLEVYGFNQERLDAIRKNLSIDASVIHKINLNQASFKEIMRHPYSSYEVAKSVCNFRTSYGKIEKTEDLRKARVINDSTYFKLLPYLSVE